MRNLYNVLGVARDADLPEIHAAYRRRAKQAHPDLSSDHLDVRFDMVEINLAWEVLSDPQRRADYDCHLAQRQPSQGHAHKPRPTGRSQDRGPWEAAVPAGFVAYPRPHQWMAYGLTRVLCAEGNRLHQGLSLSAMSTDLSGLDALAPSGVWLLDASDLALPPEQFDHIAKMTGLWRLNLSGSWLTDQTVSCLRPLTALHDLDVSSTAITDAAVPFVGAHRNSRSVIGGCRVR